MSVRSRSRILKTAIGALLLAGVLSLNIGPGALASSGGLLNSGFEDGLNDGAPLSWTVSSAPDSVKVVDAEGPGEFATYADMGNVTVAPYRGELMLRLGTPKREAEKQVRGLNTVSQTFHTNRSSLKFAFRLFSWEFRGNDVFGFNLRDQAGNPVGALTTPLVLTMPDGSQRSCTALPCQISLKVGKRGQFLDSQWVPVEISGIPLDTDVTLSYTVGGTNNKAHAT